MTLVITVTTTDQEKIIKDTMAQRRLNVEVTTNVFHQPIVEQLLGRDVIAQHARHLIQQGWQRVPNATYGLALAAGIDMVPEGAFLVCLAMAMSRSGRQIEGWSTPRLIPETVGRDLSKGGNFDTLMQNYRQQWKPVDPLSRIDIDELIERHASYGEAVAMAIDGLFQTTA